MKRAVFFILVCLTFSARLIAQDTSGAASESVAKLRFGFRAGGVVSYFSKEQPQTSEKLGFTVGGVVEYSLSDNFSIQSEPAYLQQGGRFTRFSDNTRFGDTQTIFSQYVTNSNITMHSIDLPVLAKYSLPWIGSVRPSIVVGPAIGFTMGATDSYERTFLLGQAFTTVNGYQRVTSQYEPYQVGATGGIGGEVSLGGNKRLLIDLRYRYGITTAKKSYSYIDLNAVQGDLRTHTVYFTLGFGF
ncbi:MAG: PorT family protein [Cyclobacteriaceae bacterium]|nr:PorT family protein [Cyclobacteriaceae bacterium]